MKIQNDASADVQYFQVIAHVGAVTSFLFAKAVTFVLRMEKA